MPHQTEGPSGPESCLQEMPREDSSRASVHHASPWYFPSPFRHLDLGWPKLGMGVFYSVTPAGFLFPELVLKRVPPAFVFCSCLWQAQLTTVWRPLALFGSLYLPALLDTHSFLYQQGRTLLRTLWMSVTSPLGPLFPQRSVLVYLTSPCLEIVLCFWLSLQSLPTIKHWRSWNDLYFDIFSKKNSTLNFHGTRAGSLLLLMAATLFWWLQTSLLPSSRSFGSSLCLFI